MKRYFYTDKSSYFWEKEIESEKFEQLFRASGTAEDTPAEVDAAIWSIDDPDDMGPDADDATLELVQIGGKWYSVPVAYQPSGRLAYTE